MFFDEHTIVTPGNGTRIVTATRLPVMGSDGKPQYLISLIRDLTERKRHEQRIAHMAHHDSLTDLPNRAAFNSCLAATLDLAALSSESFAVLCIDLDRFKAINDVFGHSVGDTLLRRSGAPAGNGQSRRIPGAGRRRRIHHHHADRTAAGDRRGAGRAAQRRVRHRHRYRRPSAAGRADHRRRDLSAGWRRRGDPDRQRGCRVVPREIGSARVDPFLRTVDGQATA